MNFYSYHSGQLDGFDRYFAALHRCLHFGICDNYDWNPILHIIKREPSFAYYYAYNILNRRWLEAEPYILNNLWYAHIYAIDLIKGRWLEAEPHIIKDSYRACVYATDVMKERWIDAEPQIQISPLNWKHYKQHFNIK
jgi:hypothetical protein